MEASFETGTGIGTKIGKGGGKPAFQQLADAGEVIRGNESGTVLHHLAPRSRRGAELAALVDGQQGAGLGHLAGPPAGVKALTLRVDTANPDAFTLKKEGAYSNGLWRHME